jgi:chromosome partitioning protein
MKVISIINEKGGVGKTTIATHIAGGLACSGKRVLLIDGDPQAHSTLTFGLKKQNGLYSLMTGNADLNSVVLEPDKARYAMLDQAVKGSLYIVPGNHETYAIPTVVEEADTLADILSEVEDEIDIVVIDTAPTPGLLMSLLYYATDYVIVPTQAEYLSIDGTVATINRALNFKYRPIRLMGVIPNLYEKTAVHQHNVATLFKSAQERNWAIWQPIPRRTGWREANMNRSLVWAQRNTGEAAKDALRICAQVMEALALNG